MSPTRSKSAASYRALGAKTPSCTVHSSLEYEYNYIRKVIDAVSTYPPGHPGQPSVIRSLRPSTGAPSLFHRRFTLPIQGQGYATRPHTTTHSTLQLIDIGELLNGKSGSQKARRMSSKIRAFEYPIYSCIDIDQQGCRLGSRRVILGAPNYENMTKKTFVLPVTSFAHSRLQLTGDVMKIYKSRPSPRESHESGRESHESGRVSRGSGKGVKMSVSNNSKDISRDYDIRQGQLYNSTQTIHKALPQRLMTKTDDVKHVVPVDINPGTMSTGKDVAKRPKTSELRNGLVKLDNTVPKFSLKGEKHEIRLSRTFLDDSKTPRKIAESPKSASTECEREDAKRENGISDNGIEGKTEMSNGAGTLTLSIFLPRENEEARLCHRKELTHRETEADSGSAHAFNSTDGTLLHSSQRFQEEDVFREKEGKSECSGGIETVQTSNSGHNMEQSSSRALHCELFGPELCGDCRLCKERAEEQTLQEQTYPDISTNPRQMVAAPLLRYGTLFQSDATKRYTELSVRAEGHNTPTSDRNLNSVITQNEIRSRIISAASTAKLYN